MPFEEERHLVVAYVSFSAFKDEDGDEVCVNDYVMMELYLPEKAWRSHCFTIENIKHAKRQLEAKGYKEVVILGIVPTIERNLERAERGIYPLRKGTTEC